MGDCANWLESISSEEIGGSKYVPMVFWKHVIVELKTPIHS